MPRIGSERCKISKINPALSNQASFSLSFAFYCFSNLRQFSADRSPGDNQDQFREMLSRHFSGLPNRTSSTRVGLSRILVRLAYSAVSSVLPRPRPTTERWSVLQ